MKAGSCWRSCDGGGRHGGRQNLVDKRKKNDMRTTNHLFNFGSVQDPRHYPDLGSACDCLRICFNQLEALPGSR